MEGLLFVRGLVYCKMSGEYEITGSERTNPFAALVRFFRFSNDNTAKGFRKVLLKSLS